MILSKQHIIPGILVAFAGWLAMASCERDVSSCDCLPPDELLAVPPGFPAITFPADNEFTAKRWELGKRLFFDPILSRDSTISCGSCHKAAFALADAVPVSPGVEGRLGERNAPSLFNAAYKPYFMSEGGVPSLEMQVLAPVQEHSEMDFNIVLAAERLARQPEYVAQSRQAYDRDPDPFVITRALATYERSMLSGQSAYDRFTLGNSAALSASAQRGMELFFGQRTDCAHCHSGFLFTDHSFKNNGLDTVYADPGRMRLTLNSSDEGLFKVPSLRNVAYTAPYMHNGSLPTLEAVVEHYNSGGFDFRNKDPHVRPLNLTPGERADLVEFLRSLSDPSVLNDPRFLP